jgi:hypothetical protein
MLIKKIMSVMIIFFLIFPVMNILNAQDKIAVTDAKALITDIRLYRDTEGRVPVNVGPSVALMSFSNKLATVRIDGVPEGTYNRMSFKIHKPSGNINVNDPDFGAPGNEPYSVIVKGYYNTYPFTYRSDVTANRTVVYNEPYIVGTEGSIIVTIEGDPKIWFMDRDGSVLDPTDGMNRNKIDQNIQTSFKTEVKQFDKDIKR